MEGELINHSHFAFDPNRKVCSRQAAAEPSPHLRPMTLSKIGKDQGFGSG
jgi:hypothetical protein